MPIMAQTNITIDMLPNPRLENISASAVSPSPSHPAKFPTPLTANEISAYISIEITTDNYIAVGTSLCGFLASSAMVVIKSKPRYPKNNIVDPSITPMTPFSSLRNGEKYSILKLANETKAMKNNIANFPEVTMLLNFSANSLP